MIFPIPGMARVWCFMLGCAACCPVDLNQRLPLSCPKTDKFWGLFYLSPTLQCQGDPKLVQSFKVNELRGLHICHPKRDEKMAMACILSQHALYLKLKARMNKDFLHWGNLEADQSLLFVKAKSWIKSYESLEKEKKKTRWVFWGLLRRKHRSAKDLFKNTWSFCGLWDTQTKYSICKSHAVMIQQQFPKI